MIAAEYLYQKGVLKEVVCDPIPRTQEGKDRKEQLERLGIRVSNKMPPTAKYVFVGGALTELARYLINHKIEYLVMNGGFVGCNIMKMPLEKFKEKRTVRTFNFNCDVKATDTVLKSKNIGTISECREAVEKQRAKNPIISHYGTTKQIGKAYCPNCGLDIHGKGMIGACFCCGQRISWEESEN